MSAIKDVSGTAFVVAEYRAEENREPTPLYVDPVVELFLSDASREAAARVSSRFPAVKDMVKTRTRYFDDMLDNQIAAGVWQVVILGAGLDTRAVRKSSPGVRYFEIDDPATIELKRRCYADARIDPHVTTYSRQLRHGRPDRSAAVERLRRSTCRRISSGKATSCTCRSPATNTRCSSSSDT